MRSRVRLTSAAMFVFLASLSARGQETRRFAEWGDFRPENGQRIRQCRIGYRTFGALNADKGAVKLTLEESLVGSL